MEKNVKISIISTSFNDIQVQNYVPFNYNNFPESGSKTLHELVQSHDLSELKTVPIVVIKSQKRQISSIPGTWGDCF